MSTTIDHAFPDVLAPRPASGPVDAVVRVPGSKSITNRALLVAALADGDSELVGALHSDDTRYMAAALNALGVAVERDPSGNRFRVRGGGGHLPGRPGRPLRRQRRHRDALPDGGPAARPRRLPHRRRAADAPAPDRAAAPGAARSRRRRSRASWAPAARRSSSAAAGLPGGRARMAGDQSSQYFTALLLVGALRRATGSRSRWSASWSRSPTCR